jgi:predicted MFS family arabinose efflux permease
LEFALPVFIYLKTGDVTMSGLALAIEWAPRVLSLPAAGALVESFTIRRQLINIDLVRAGLAMSLPLLHSPYALMVAGGVLSLCNGYAMLLAETALARAVPAATMPAAQGRMQVAAQLSQTVGPFLAGLALPRLGFGATCLAIGSLFVVGAVSIGVVTAAMPVLRAAGTRTSLRNVPGNLLAGVRAVVRRPALVRLILLTALVNLVGGLALAALPALVTHDFRAGTTAVGVVLGAASLASVVSAVAATFVLRRTPLRRIAAGAGVCLAGAAFWMAGADHLLGFAAAFALWSAAVTVFVIWMRTRRLELLGGESVGSALGVFVAAILFATPLSGGILAVLGDRLTPQQLLFALAVLATVGGVILLAIDRRAARRRGVRCTDGTRTDPDPADDPVLRP